MIRDGRMPSPEQAKAKREAAKAQRLARYAAKAPTPSAIATRQGETSTGER
jgi:hypothetical protein